MTVKLRRTSSWSFFQGFSPRFFFSAFITLLLLSVPSRSFSSFVKGIAQKGPRSAFLSPRCKLPDVLFPPTFSFYPFERKYNCHSPSFLFLLNFSRMLRLCLLTPLSTFLEMRSGSPAFSLSQAASLFPAPPSDFLQPPPSSHFLRLPYFKCRGLSIRQFSHFIPLIIGWIIPACPSPTIRGSRPSPMLPLSFLHLTPKVRRQQDSHLFLAFR